MTLGDYGRAADVKPEDYERWLGEFIQTIAREIKYWRVKRGLSAQQLCDRLENDYGLPFKRSVLANLENGRRPSLSVAELLLIAQALDVPPMQLLFSVGRQREVSVGPGKTVPIWLAMDWFRGGIHLPDGRGGEGSLTTSEEAAKAWSEGSAALDFYATHNDAVARRGLLYARFQDASLAAQSIQTGQKPYASEALTRSTFELADTEARAAAARVDQQDEHIRVIRSEIRKLGLLLPDLPEDLRDLDDSQRPTTVQLLGSSTGGQ